MQCGLGGLSTDICCSWAACPASCCKSSPCSAAHAAWQVIPTCIAADHSLPPAPPSRRKAEEAEEEARLAREQERLRQQFAADQARQRAKQADKEVGCAGCRGALLHSATAVAVVTTL